MSIEMRNVKQLNEEQFIIPAYQRGYRWEDSHVNDLLGDVSDFINTDLARFKKDVNPSADEQAGPHYILQPIIVTNRKNGWEVIDGQNRLTTIALILHFFQSETSFNITYTNKPIDFKGSEAGVSSLADLCAIDPDKAETSEEYYIAKAYRCIEEYFKGHPELNPQSWKNDFEQQVQVIWQEEQSQGETTEETKSAIAAFERINIGKIPLNDVELIRAEMLMRPAEGNRTAQKDRQHIAKKWYTMEKKLKDEDKWSFLMQGQKGLVAKAVRSRIALFFQLYYLDHNKESGNLPTSERALFTYFQELLNNKEDGASAMDIIEWFEVRFGSFIRIYNDKDLYHPVGGYLFQKSIESKESDYFKVLLEVLDEYSKNSDAFSQEWIYPKLQEAFKSLRDELKNRDEPVLNYGDDKKDKIRQVLFLYSLALLHNGTGDRKKLLFAKYYKDRWDIDHIRPQTDNNPKQLKELLESIEASDLSQTSHAKKLIKKAKKISESQGSSSDEKRQEVISELLNMMYDEIEDEEVGYLPNLTLLPKGLNIALSNKIFSQKAADVTKDGRYLLEGTRKVFCGKFSKDGQIVWDKNVAENYYDDLRSEINKFLGWSGENDE